jgi:hypothetical protein
MKNEMDVLCDTILHVAEVKEGLEQFRTELTKRGLLHDMTKFQEPEFSAFVMTRPRFKKVNYGTSEYQKICDEVKPALDHHYANNRHHTAYHKNGINDMNLIDILEMIADWKAAERRSPDKSLKDTLEFAFKKYGIEEQLGTIIQNTLKNLNWI